MKPNDPAPYDLNLIGTDEKVSLTGFNGKVLPVNFWATWCPPCVEEMPDLNALQGLRGGEDFHVAAISLDTEGPDVVMDFLNENALHDLQPYLGNGLETFKHFRLAELPTTLLPGPDGKIRGTLSGPADWDSKEELALIDHARRLASETKVNYV